MALYVDGFLLPLPKKKVPAYRKLAREASRVWKRHGALEYRERIAEDMTQKGEADFVTRTRAKSDQTVVFAWIVYRSRKDRDRVNTLIMKDPVILRMMKLMKDKKRMPFDSKRMSWGGFEILVDA